MDPPSESVCRPIVPKSVLLNLRGAPAEVHVETPFIAVCYVIIDYQSQNFYTLQPGKINRNFGDICDRLVDEL